ncbi:ATP-binding protein [Acidovorax lacteus]|uniref:histidine kinase n=1 Tax=Acidovorax lacteus TaxID=1924988 RepID=A0ABP8L3C9_9BURK
MEPMLPPTPPAEPALAWDGPPPDSVAAVPRRTLWALLAMLALVVLSVALLVAYLQREEAQDRQRRQNADAEWLDQTLRFQLRRLESDLLLAAAAPAGANTALPRAGTLWRTTGVVRARLPLRCLGAPPAADGAEALPHPAELRTLLDTVYGLQRSAYAGPLPAAEGRPATLWLALPLPGRGDGCLLAELGLDALLDAAVPAWFAQEHHLRVLWDPLAWPPAGGSAYEAPVQLPGAALRLAVEPLAERTPLAPRVFFGVAMLALLGMLALLALLLRDAARRRRVEAQLQAQRTLRAALERAAPVGLVAWDAQGTLRSVNAAFRHTLGMADGRDAERPPFWPLPLRDAAQPFPTCCGLAAAPGESLETALPRPGAEPVEMLVQVAPLTQPDGRTLGWVGAFLDITERRAAERLAAEQQRKLDASGRLIAVGEVASTLAHELNQPLGALSSFAHGLLNRVQAQRINPDELASVVERMARMADKAGRVIQRANQLARRQHATREPLDLCALAQQMALPPGVRLALDVPPGPCTVPADGLLLEHALRNLLANAAEWALHAQPADAQVLLRVLPATEGAAEVGLCVEDNGPGVPDDQRTAIFDAFTSHKPGGMGMGLSICRSVAEAHGGRITVERSAQLHGAQFTLWLPNTP